MSKVSSKPNFSLPNFHLMIASRRSFITLLFSLACLPTLAQDVPPAAHSRDILVIGDSLSAEYGLRQGSGWVSIVAEKLKSRKYKGLIHNASISGDTTSGGLSRLSGELARYKPGIVIIELGSNDALRGLSLTMTKNNLSAMVAAIQKSDARVLLVGMQIPSNYGRRYTEQFRDLFVQVAAHYHIPLVPFLMEGMATNKALFQADGLHPNEKGQPILAKNVWTYLAPMLDTRHAGTHNQGRVAN